MKDFKDSYEQLAWSNAARFHKIYTELLEPAMFEATKVHARKRLDEIEKEFPQLKEK